jgi:hypothetical protein
MVTARAGKASCAKPAALRHKVVAVRAAFMNIFIFVS